ncbi:hypothetical protein ACQ4PT_017378 [Festuca glaucescens]
METAAAVSVSRSACRAALPSPASRQGRVAFPRTAPRQRLVARRAAAGDNAEEELPIEKSRSPSFISPLFLCDPQRRLTVCALAGIAAYPTVMDINQIREILPHRFPFLLVDRVIEYKAGEYAVAIKNVTINDNFFPGHFPERPIMPGVLMVEDSKTLAMMEEDEPLAHAPTSPAIAPTIVHYKVNAVSMGISSGPPSKASEDQSAVAQAPMDMEMEADGQQHQLCQNASFFSGL